MYVPPHFRVEDEPTLRAFIDRHGFATLITVRDGVPFASHLPLLLSADGRTLRGHVARANPQWRQLDGTAEALAIFSGPHAYVSPTWYVSSPAVPTWNYAAVHVYGPARTIDDVAWLEETTLALTRKYEALQPEPWDGALPDAYRRGLLAGVVGLEVAVARVEGKFKVGQNRPAADRESMTRRLEGGDADARSLAAFIRRLGSIQ